MYLCKRDRIVNYIVVLGIVTLMSGVTLLGLSIGREKTQLGRQAKIGGIVMAIILGPIICFLGLKHNRIDWPPPEKDVVHIVSRSN